MTISSPFDILLPKLSGRFTLVDIGARWGALSAWEVFGSRANIICFEPDEDEARRLQQCSAPHVKYIPVALGAFDGTLPLTVTAEPACSSVYPPVKKLYTDYPELALMTPEREITVPARRLDGVLADEGIDAVYAIKLDTQGSELDILRGAEKALEAVELIDIEVEFNPLYEGQYLFWDVDRYLRDHGFVLWRISDLVHYSPTSLPGCSSSLVLAANPGGHQVVQVPSGQLYFAQAQYVRADLPRTGAPALPLERALRAAALMGAYKFWDLSVEVLHRGGAPEAAAEIASFLQRNETQATRQDDPATEHERLRNDLAAENEHLRRQLAQRQDESAAYHEQINAIKESNSWRLTAPLRAIKRLLP